LLQLEDRVVPTVTLGAHFIGMGVNDTPGAIPPDPIAAVGPTQVIETVNTDIAIYPKDSSGTWSYKADFTAFFASVQSGSYFSDCTVLYDDLIGRWFVGLLDFKTDPSGATLVSTSFDYAVSTTSSPRGARDFRAYAVNLTNNDPDGANAFVGDFPRVGWNANAFTVSFNMFTSDSSQVQDHVLLLNINPQSPATTTLLDIEGVVNSDVAPVTMHGATATTPMYILAETLDASGNATGDSLTLYTETDPLGSPKLTSTTLSVAPYTAPPPATQTDSADMIATNDSRILNADWRNNVLVATQNVGVFADAQCHVRWYQLSTAGSSPVLQQQGTLGVGSGADSYYPCIAIAPGGTLGLTYMESSPQEDMSVYVTGRAPNDPSGQMESAVLVQAGETPYFVDPQLGLEDPPYRAGDFSGIEVDSDGSFWACSEFASSDDYGGLGFGINWGTALGNFKVSSSAPPQLAQAPAVNGNTSALAGAQRSMVDSLAYTFSKSVSLAANAFTIALHPTVTVNGTTGQTVGTLPALSWSSPDGGVTWVVTFSGAGVVNGSIADGVYDITLNHAAVTDATGQAMSADRTDTFYRLYGDTNGDGTVNNSDTFQFKSTFLKNAGDAGYLAYLDYNGDGTINNTDAFQLKKRFLTSYTGFTATI
jgi:hypothetical protein